MKKKFSKGYQKLAVIFVFVLLFLTFFSKSFYNYSLPSVTVIEPKQGTLDFSFEGSGEISYANVCSHYAGKDGVIQDILIHEGDKIKKGNVVMKIKNPDTNRRENIRAEQTGIVTSVKVQKGMYVSYMSNSVLYETAGSSSEMSVMIKISDDEASRIQKGNKVMIRIPGLDESFEGKVTDVSSYADETSQGYYVDIRFQSNDHSILGKRAELMIQNEVVMSDALVPVSALHKDSAGYYVFVLQANDSVLSGGYKAQRYSVDLVDSDEEYCAVEGLMGEEQVILASTKEIAEGDFVYYEAGEEEEK